MRERQVAVREVSAWMLACAGALLAASCATSHTAPSEVGGESHFLRACEGPCGEGLDCIDGVCTRACDADEACSDVNELARCPDPSGVEVARSCEVTCIDDAECTAVSALLGCAAGVCREQGIEVQNAPLVMLAIDTSGSMERLLQCACTTPSCDECLPDCERGQRNGFARVLEALSGTWESFRCTTLERTTENATDELTFSYDLGYYLPYHRPPLDQQQLGDGVLDAYRARVRFGMATFDGWDTYIGAPPLVGAEEFDDALSTSVEGMWSYGPGARSNGRLAGAFRYPNGGSAYRMDTGIRGPRASNGAVQHAAHVSEMLAVNARIQDELRRVRPYGGTPIASALDDLLYYLTRDPETLARNDDRPDVRFDRPQVVLITDGYPDDDYRSFGCDCANELASDPMACGDAALNDPADMFCPYPTAEEAAAALAAHAPVHVIFLPTAAPTSGPSGEPDPAVVDRANAIAAAGGTGEARIAADTGELRDALGAIFEAAVREQTDRDVALGAP